MKILKVLLLTCLLSIGHAFADTAASKADEKWLQAVEKMVIEGKMKVSTPSETRVNLLKDWAWKKGYSVTSTKIGDGYQVELSKSVAKK